MPTSLPALTPLLVVRDAARAIDFYEAALGARTTARYVDRRRGAVSHADLAVGDATLSVTEEARAWNSDAPVSLGGSPVVLQLRVEDVEARLERMLAAGSELVFPLQEFCGERMARVRDPFGHLWILGQRLEELTVDEIQRRRDAWALPGQSSKSPATLGGSPASTQGGARGSVHLVVGPVGAGKSTFAIALAREHRALRLDLDESMAALFRPDRPETGVAEWYVERAARCVDVLWKPGGIGRWPVRDHRAGSGGQSLRITAGATAS